MISLYNGIIFLDRYRFQNHAGDVASRSLEEKKATADEAILDARGALAALGAAVAALAGAAWTAGELSMLTCTSGLIALVWIAAHYN